MQWTPNRRLARKQRQEFARNGLRGESSVATASDYLHHLIDLIEWLQHLPPLIRYCRVSDVKQFRSGNADDLAAWATSELNRLGLGHAELHNIRRVGNLSRNFRNLKAAGTADVSAQRAAAT